VASSSQFHSGAVANAPDSGSRRSHREPDWAIIVGFAGIILRHKETIMASAKPKKKNPRLASGRKRVRQDVKINAANTSLRSKYRTAVKNVEKAVLAGDKTKALNCSPSMQSVVDTVADKGIFHKNKAARDKSRLSAKVKALALAAGRLTPAGKQPGVTTARRL
jgi:small subunit ribosomal protein S20